MRRALAAAALSLTVAIVAASCSSTPSTEPTSTAATVATTITVSAAASLTEPFNRIGADFKAAEGTTVEFTFDSSSTLSRQILDGAPVDALASADTDNMKKLTDADKTAGTPVTFARNELVIVTKAGNPKAIAGLESLPTAGTISLCGADVPCGKYAAQALQKANVTVPESSVTRGQNVKATLTAVTEGDADAAIVYVTDAKTAGDKVATVKIPETHNVVATYPAAVIGGSKDQGAADAFVQYLTGTQAQAVLAEYGFLPPT